MDQRRNRYLNQLKQFQQQGYQSFSKGDYDEAVHSWQPMWLLLGDRLETDQALDLESINGALPETIGKWSADYLQAMNMSFADTDFELSQIRPVLQALMGSQDQSKSYELKNQQRLLADTIFKSRGPESGDPLYETLLASEPSWGWGWISWAHQYSFNASLPWYSLQRAEEILRRALRQDVLNNANDVKEKLRDVLLKMGRTAEASGIELGHGSVLDNFRQWISDNRLCDCGSGQKYKNCCKKKDG